MKKKPQIEPSTLKAKTGSFIILPMLPAGGDCSFRRIAGRLFIDTPDISLNVLEMLNREGYVVECRKLSTEDVNRGMFGVREDYDLILDGREENRLELGDIFIFEFHTGVVLVGVSVLYSRMEMLQRICYPGYAKGDCRYSFRAEKEEILLEDRLKEWLGSLGLLPFYEDSPLFLEAFVHNIAVVPERFRKMKEIAEITFNMHLMAPLGQPVTDASEEDVSYVYAVKDQVLGSYRWGCCISSQTISYVICDETMDLKREMETESRDTLPVVMLALYEKYTCLYFDRLLAEGSQKRERDQAVSDLCGGIRGHICRYDPVCQALPLAEAAGSAGLQASSLSVREG